MSTKIDKPHTGKTRNDVPVLYSDRCFPYAILGRSSKQQGMIGFFKTADRPSLKQVPTGTMIVNLDTFQLEISLCDPNYPPSRWLSPMVSGSQIVLGVPTDGSYSDGLIAISGGMTIADAVDAINEQLIICCSGSPASPEFASHLGTTDGTTNGVLESPSFVIGRVASPTSSGVPFYAGGWDDDTNRDLTNSSSFDWELAGGEKITDLHTGTIVATYSDPSGELHVETLTLDGTVNDQASTPNGYITVNNLANHPQVSSVIEGFITISVPTNAILGGSTQSGKVDVNIDHEVSIGNSFTQDLHFFKDGSSAPSFTSQLVELGTLYSRFLSGVEFISIQGANRSSLSFSIESPNIWKDTYRADPLLVNSSNYGIPNFTVPYNSAEVTKDGGPSALPYIHDEDFVFSGSREITQPVVNPDSNGTFLTVSAQLRDPFFLFNGPAFSGVPALLINTFPISSTDTLEMFVDEEYRVDPSTSGSSLTGPDIDGADRGPRIWDSTESLVSASGLQVINGALVFPQADWSIYVPNPNPDYTVMPGLSPAEGLSYNRQFRSASARTNGVLRIEGMTEADRTSGDIKVFIRVVGPHITGDPNPGAGNTGTGWLDLSEPFDFGTFNGDDGDGCFITTGGYSAPNFQFSLGNFSTAFSENEAIEVMVIFPNTAQGRSKRITRMEIIDW